uniref:hypothetical protein n=1 Tax=Sphingopyxis fribergensis TaxID=1515612 RepID=UPI00389B2999
MGATPASTATSAPSPGAALASIARFASRSPPPPAIRARRDATRSTGCASLALAMVNRRCTVSGAAMS